MSLKLRNIAEDNEKLLQANATNRLMRLRKKAVIIRSKTVHPLGQVEEILLSRVGFSFMLEVVHKNMYEIYVSKECIMNIPIRKAQRIIHALKNLKSIEVHRLVYHSVSRDELLFNGIKEEIINYALSQR